MTRVAALLLALCTFATVGTDQPPQTTLELGEKLGADLAEAEETLAKELLRVEGTLGEGAARDAFHAAQEA